MIRWKEMQMVRATTPGWKGSVPLLGLCALLGWMSLSAAALAAAPLWQGQVVSPEGQPVPAAQVWVYTEGTLEKEARAVGTMTDSEGRFMVPTAGLPDVPPEARVFIATAEGRALAWKRQTEIPDPSQLRLVLGPAVPFSGRVRDPSQRPRGNVTVRAAYLVIPAQEQAPRRFLVLDPALPLLTTKTKADGTFTLPGIPPEAQVWLELVDPESAWKLLPVAASEAADLDLTLVPTGHLAGRVTVAETGQPVAGVLVCCEGGSPPKIQAQVLTDAEGRYRLSFLEEGSYRVRVQFPQPLPEWAPAARGNVRVVAGQTTEGVDLELVRGEVLTGKVVEEGSGAPLAGARVEVFHPQSGESFFLTADEQGGFRFRAGPGSVQVILRSVPRGYVCDPQKDLRQVTIATGERPPEILFEVPQGLSVAGRAVDEQGHPVANAVITTGGMGTGHAISDAEGHFVLVGLKPGQSVTLQATQPSQGLAGAAQIRIAADMKEITLTLERAPRVQGRIVNEAGQPLPEATVTVFVVQEAQGQQFFSPLSPRVQSNRFGRYEVTGLLPGLPFFLQAEAEGYSPTRTEVFTAAAGEVKRLDDLPLPRANAFLAGRVTDPEGNPIPGVEIQAYGGVSQPLPGIEMRVLGGPSRKAVTDAEGRYRLEQLVKGTVYVNLQHPDYYADFQGEVKTGAEDADFVLMRKTIAPPKTLQWGMPAPELQVSQWINGDIKSLADLRGRVVLLAFCPFHSPSCRDLLPQLQSLHREYHEAGLTVLQIVDHSAPPKELEALAREMGLTYPIGWVEPSADLGWSSPTFGHYGVEAVPALFLIDKQGLLRYEEDGARLERRVKALLLE